MTSRMRAFILHHCLTVMKAGNTGIEEAIYLLSSTYEFISYLIYTGYSLRAVFYLGIKLY